MSNFAKFALAAVAMAVLLSAWAAVGRRRDDALVLYCAHDLMFAQEIVRDFEKKTGISVVVVGDTEATKSLGLVQRLLREKDHPRCDVFWNNQVLGTIQLAKAGVLQPYRGEGYERIRSTFKDADGRWTGFGGRFRVWIVNTEQISADQDSIESRYVSEDLSRMAIAEPLYGTTLSHMSLIWEKRGASNTKDWFESITQRGCRIVPGNSTVKNLVATAVCDFGWTDTDDFFVGLDDGAPIAMLPIREEGQTICIPNSVGLIRGTRKRQQAIQFIEYLLSEETELKMAHSPSRQVPLGPVDRATIPAEVRPLLEWVAESVDITDASAARSDCMTWLQTMATEGRPQK